MTGALAAVAAGYARTILGAIQQEYPNHLRHVMNAADDRPTPREVHPAFYGCLDRHLTDDALRAEAVYFVERPGFERPYGWGWALMLAAELTRGTTPMRAAGALRWRR